MLHQDKWCKYHWQPALTLSVNPAFGLAELWIHAGSQGAILDQSIWRFGRLLSGSRRSPRTPFLSVEHRAGQSGNRPRSWFEFGMGTTLDRDIKGLVKYVRWR